jgi:UDP-N-acetyl-2-amino-2-deoxyglucuronate dehydrogenase
MRFALVGCAVIAPTHVRAIQALSGRVELVSCSDVVPERADVLAKEFGPEPRAFADVLADPAIDAVTVCTPRWECPPCSPAST